MRGQNESLGSDTQFDLIVQPALLNQGLGNANPSGVTDTCELDSHNIRLRLS